MKEPWKAIVIPLPDKRRSKAANAEWLGGQITQHMNALAREGRNVLHPFMLPDVGIVMVGMTERKAEQVRPAVLSRGESMNLLQAALNTVQHAPQQEDRLLKVFVERNTTGWDMSLTRDVMGDLQRIASTHPTDNPIFTRVVNKLQTLLGQSLQMHLQ